MLYQNVTQDISDKYFLACDRKRELQRNRPDINTSQANNPKGTFMRIADQFSCQQPAKRPFSATAILLALPMLCGCSSFDLKRFTYETLRQEDCRRNDLEVFCSRGFANEYHDYERTRREFMRKEAETDEQWRTKLLES